MAEIIHPFYESHRGAMEAAMRHPTASSCPEFAPNGNHAAVTRRMLSGDKRTWLRPLKKVQAPARSSFGSTRYDCQRAIRQRPLQHLDRVQWRAHWVLALVIGGRPTTKLPAALIGSFGSGGGAATSWAAWEAPMSMPTSHT